MTGGRLAAQAENYTDACLVLRDGEILLEHYANGMGPDTPHLMNSCTKTWYVPASAFQPSSFSIQTCLEGSAGPSLPFVSPTAAS